MSNLDTYNKVKSVPSNAMKSFNNGNFKGTDINTMWRIKTLTELYGPCGIGWYYEIVRQWEREYENEIAVFVDIALHIKVDCEWSKPIYGTGGNKVAKYNTNKKYYSFNDEGYKMATTDAFGNACRNLGIGADVYWENDKTKYSQPPNDDSKPSVNIETLDDAMNYTLKSGDHKGKTLGELSQTKDGQAYLQKLYKYEKTDKAIKSAIAMISKDTKEKERNEADEAVNKVMENITTPANAIAGSESEFAWIPEQEETLKEAS